MAHHIKTIARNKKAQHDFFIEDRIEGGLALKGPEVKSLRDGHCSLVDSYARFIEGELFLIGMNIPPYKNLGYAQHDSIRDRKVLLHKEELKKLFRQVMEKGVTLIPVKIYFKNGRAKVEIAVATGKKQYDKRADIQKRDQKREQGRLNKQYNVK